MNTDKHERRLSGMKRFAPGCGRPEQSGSFQVEYAALKSFQQSKSAIWRQRAVSKTYRHGPAGCLRKADSGIGAPKDSRGIESVAFRSSEGSSERLSGPNRGR